MTEITNKESEMERLQERKKYIISEILIDLYAMFSPEDAAASKTFEETALAYEFLHQRLPSFDLSASQIEKIRSHLKGKYNADVPLDFFSLSTSNPNDSVSINRLAHFLSNKGIDLNYRPSIIQGDELFDEVIRRDGYDNDNFFYVSFRKVFYLLLSYVTSFLQTLYGRRPKKTSNGDKNTQEITIKNEVLDKTWFTQHQIQSHEQSYFFPNSYAQQRLEISKYDEFYFLYLGFQIFGVFIYFPLELYLLFKFCEIRIAIMLLLLLIAYIYGPDYSEYPPCFRRHQGFRSAIKYFSYRAMIEAPTQAYQGISTIYTFGPHGVFGIGPTIQALLNSYFVGENMHILGATAIFYMPLYNMFLQMMSFKDISRKTFKNLLLAKRSVGIIPGGIAEMFYAGKGDKDEGLIIHSRKGFVALALETGTQIVPCYSFGNTQIFYSGSTSWLEKLSRSLRMSIILFWGRWGLPVPMKEPIFTVIGTPIQCPRVDNPSKELIQAYHQLYMNEIRRLFETYKNAYGWEKRRLVFKG
jgi:hypothetical protein